MDIRRWLEETKTPGPPASLGLPAGQHARESGARDAAKRSSHQNRRRKRPQKHLSSDSSLLRLNRTNDSHHPVTQEAGNGDRAQQHTASDKTASRCSSELSGSADRSGSELYTRRPRRKTRPEIYEPKADKKQSGRHRERRKTELAPTRKKTRRRTKHRQPDPAHAFHAKNVAKVRLTIKPREGLGLFKKGRASSPVKGRGLPDLVFSEMRFLQKRSDPKDNQLADEASRKRRKIDNDVGQEDEISAYFAAKRPALAERDGNIPTKKRSECLPKGKARHASSSSINPNSIEPPIELPEKPYLGFGTRGADPASGSDTTYYIPWSESVGGDNEAAPQRSSEIQLRQPVDAERQHNAEDHLPIGVGRAVHHQRRQGSPDLLPLETASRCLVQVASKVAGCAGAQFLQEETYDDPKSRPGDSETTMPTPPSSHKHRTKENRQELTHPPRRQATGRDKGDTSETDANEQHQRCTKHTRKGKKPQGEFDACDGQNGNVRTTQDGATDTIKAQAPLRSSSPLGKLLRRCDDACHDPPSGPRAPELRESSNRDTEYYAKSVEIQRAASPAEWRSPPVPLRWASSIVPNHAVLYQMQVPRMITFEDHGAVYAARENVSVPDLVGDGFDHEVEYLEDLAGVCMARDESMGDFDMGCALAPAGDSYGGSLYGNERWSGRPYAGQQREEEGSESGEGLARFWRPHKLY